MKINDIRKLHKGYLEDVAKYPGFLHDHDASTRPEGIFHLIRLLEESGAAAVGEFGSGFSTYALRTWREQSGRAVQFTTVEHDAKWVDFIKKNLRDNDLPDGDIIGLDDYRGSTRMMAARPFDAVFIDHGPTMASRWDDVPWIASLVKPGGLVIFDDWWPEHVRAFRSTKRIIRILARMGLAWEVVEDSRPAEHDKAICVVRIP